MKNPSISLFLAMVVLLVGCTGGLVQESTDETTTTPTVSSATVPTEAEWMNNPEWKWCTAITPEEGVLILHGKEIFQDTVINGDVYITANAAVDFKHVWVRGDLYVHGKLTVTRLNQAYGIYAYKQEDTLCSAYDGIHGEIKTECSGGMNCHVERCCITADALDYAFETWGKVEPIQKPLTEVRPEDLKTVEPSPFDPAEARIISGKQALGSEVIKGDVYITSDADITFYSVIIYGNLYVYGKLHVSDLLSHLGENSQIHGCLFAYDFGVTCDAFDGAHGQVTGGPIYCEEYMVANDALDYAFETWGKQ